MNIDYGTMITVLILVIIITVSTSIYLLSCLSMKKSKIRFVISIGSIKLSYFKKLVKENYCTFDKYQIWRYTIYKRISSGILN